MPRGVLSALTLSADHQVVRAAVLYSVGVETYTGDVVCWVFWEIVRHTTEDGKPIWTATPYQDAQLSGAPLRLRILNGNSAFTSHQLKGLAVALGIWASMRKPPMLQHAGVLSRQTISGETGADLAEHLKQDSHYGLSERAGETEWGV